MKEIKNDIWIGVEDLTQDQAFLDQSKEEFQQVSIAEDLPDSGLMEQPSNRRDFLKFLGFGLGAATVAASCDIPVRRAIPYLVKPDTIVPGVATYYASSFVNGGDYCAILVKTREGRPIKIEGNTLSSVTKGGTSARAQASVLSLYDTNRYQAPLKGGKTSDWATIDKEIGGKLATAKSIRIVTGTIMSPSSKAALAAFVAKYPSTQVVSYDAVSYAAMLDANLQNFGERVLPEYRFDKANVIVSFNADFLGTWISPVEYANQHSIGRKIVDPKNAKMSRHIQIESAMTLTGSNADNRILVKPSEQGAAIANLFNEVAKLTGSASINAGSVNAKAKAALVMVAKDLVANKGASLVVAGSNNLGEQVLVNGINAMLDNYGNTLGFANASYQRQGDDKAAAALMAEMTRGGVDTLIVWGANPAFDMPEASAFAAAMKKVATKISFGYTPDETSALCDYIAPGHHYLESWGDVEPKKGKISLIQPTISPLFKTRQAEETLLRWAGVAPEGDQPYMQFVKNNLANNFLAASGFASVDSFWDSVLHDGIIESGSSEVGTLTAINADFAAAAGLVSAPSNAKLEVEMFETVNMGDGNYAGNPWLQEMPDPITRCVWGNYVGIPIEFDGVRTFNSVAPFIDVNAEEFKRKADILGFKVNGKEASATAVRQFGLMPGVLTIGLGYGRTVAGQAGANIGTDVNPWLTRSKDGYVQYYSTAVEYNGKVGIDKEFACVQHHHTLGVTGKDKASNETVNVDESALVSATLGMFSKGYQGSLTDRSIIYRANLDEVGDLAAKIKEKREAAEHLNSQTLYPYEEFTEKYYSQGHHWGMHIDLSACVGCGACQVACVAENNVPVVGKYEVFRHHEMTWLRIDRYFYGDYENPKAVYQPMMCQHCDNAPCENVCPVSATNHSSEGLNQMTYNRCIGTRYCANNCPYKVRRFNWLDYTTADLFPANEPKIGDEELPFYGDNLTRMVLNPDVTVRSRGVIEKCSFCVQRLQEGKLQAKVEGRALRDSDVKSACQTACPTGAITFGDMNNNGDALDTLLKNKLNYQVLEEINTRPGVMYAARVVNSMEGLA